MSSLSSRSWSSSYKYKVNIHHFSQVFASFADQLLPAMSVPAPRQILRQKPCSARYAESILRDIAIILKNMKSFLFYPLVDEGAYCAI